MPAERDNPERIAVEIGKRIWRGRAVVLAADLAREHSVPIEVLDWEARREPNEWPLVALVSGRLCWVWMREDALLASVGYWEGPESTVPFQRSLCAAIRGQLAAWIHALVVARVD